MFQKSEQINELATALAKAQMELKPATKETENPYFKSKYADLSSVWASCRDVLGKHGLAVIQLGDSSNPDEVALVTVLTHASGQWISGRLAVKLEKSTAQAIGSTVSYFRRYGLSAIVGISVEDDDGHVATHAKPQNNYTAPYVPPADAFPPPSFDPNEPMPNFDELPGSTLVQVKSTPSVDSLAALADKIMKIGKHAGKTLREVKEKDKDGSYARWVAEMIAKNKAEGKNVNESFLLYEQYAVACGEPLGN